MARRTQHWMNDVIDNVISRQQGMTKAMADGISDRVPFGKAPPPPKPPGLQEFLQADPQERQAYLQGLPDDQFAKTVSKLQSDAVSRFGAMASTLTPIFQLAEGQRAQGGLQAMQASGLDGQLGVQAAALDLQDLLGVDPTRDPAE